MPTTRQDAVRILTRARVAAGRSSHRFTRWLYRGGRPNRLARLVNWHWAVIGATGLLLPERLATLDVRGRSTGRLISFPVVIADYAGERYLVSMLGENTNWVRNVRAAAGRAVLRHGRCEAVHLREIDPADRARILRRYLDCAPGARPHIPVDRRAPLAEFERIAARIPVFRVVPDRPAVRRHRRVPRWRG